MNVYIKKHHLAYFRKKARETSNEILAVLLGFVYPNDGVEVVKLSYPILDVSTPNSVHANEESFRDIEKNALLNGLKILGSIHTHPNYIPVMSGMDYDDFKNNKEIIAGIVEVTDNKTRVVFWCGDTPLPCKIKYL